MGNMNCLAQKANSKEYNNNFNRIFNKRPFFDVVDELDKILEEANKMDHVEDKIEMRYCRLCEEPCGEMLRGEWENLWNQVCDDCVTAMDKGEIV